MTLKTYKASDTVGRMPDAPERKPIMTDTSRSVDARKLSKIYYEAINVYPPATQDFAGFRAIEKLLADTVLRAELDLMIAIENAAIDAKELNALDYIFGFLSTKRIELQAEASKIKKGTE